MAYKQVIHTILCLLIYINTTAQSPEWEWARSANSGGYEEAMDVSTDPTNEDVYVAGTWFTNLSTSFPSGAHPSTDFTSTYGGQDGFVAKFNKDGDFLWAFKVGGNSSDMISAISVDPSGNFFITGTFGTGTGYFSGTSIVTPASTLTNSNRDDFFIAKYDSSGAFQWVRRSESDISGLTGLDLSATSTSVFVVGQTSGPATFGSLSLTATFGNSDMFLVRYDSTGAEQWLISAGSSNQDFSNGVAADESDVYLIGDFKGPEMEFTNTSGTTVSSLINSNSGIEEIFLASYNINGDFNWSRPISGNGKDKGHALTLDSDSLYITGSISNLVNFPSFAGNPVTSSIGQDIFISSHSKLNGNTGWAYSIPCSNNGDENGLSITQKNGKDLFMTGYFMGDIIFPDATTLISAGAEDVFVASYTSNGTFNWAKKAGSSLIDRGNGIAAGSNGALYLVGAYSNLMSFDLLTLPGDVNDNVFIAKLQLPCSDAVGGSLSAAANDICFGEGTLLRLQSYSGEITWQQSPAGTETWTAIPDEILDSIVVSPLNSTDYRAYLSSGTCIPDSSNIVNVEVLVIPDADAGTESEECDLDFQLQATPSAGSGVWTITSGPGNASFTPAVDNPNAVVTVDQYGSYQFTWTETNGICGDADTISVVFYEQPSTDAGADAEICASTGTFSITGSTSANGTILWSTSGDGSFDAPLTDNPTYTTGSESGTVFLIKTVTSPGSCAPAIDSITLVLTPDPVSDAGSDGESCGQEYQLLAIPSIGIGSWTQSSGPGIASFSPLTNRPDALVMVNQYGTYEFTWTETNGSCTDQNSVTVIFYEPVTSDAGPDQELDFTFSTYMNAHAPDAGTGVWELVRGSAHIMDNNDPVSLITGLSLGENEFSWIVRNGACEDIHDNIVITVNDIVTPTVITPNGDGQNDFLVFPGIEQLSGSEILIYNRWGNEVFRNPDYQNDWDGRDHKDRELIPDTYYYILKLELGRTISSYVEIKR